MAITFDEIEFPGTHASPQMDAPEQRSVRSTFAGLDGEVEVRLGRGGRDISVTMIVHSDSYRRASDVNAKLKEFDEKVGYHGKLKIGDREFPNCTFRGFAPIGGVLPDFAGTLNPDSSGTRYFVRGTATFRQLHTEAV